MKFKTEEELEECFLWIIFDFEGALINLFCICNVYVVQGVQ